jgi:DNA-directed RNA polymerase
MAGVIWKSIGETVIAAKDAMAFLRDVSKLASEADVPVRWTTPLGLPIVQKYMGSTVHAVKVHYEGQRLQLEIQEDTKEIDKRRQAAGVAPNFIHSLDSAHLMATVNVGLENDLTHWAVIHDSFGVHAADVDVLHACIREAFIEQYTPNVLQRFRDEIVEQFLGAGKPNLVSRIPPVPQQGTLDIHAVRESAYFFA